MITDDDAQYIPHPLWAWEWSESVAHMEVMWCSVVLALAGILCSAAGIGGGGVYVAALMIIGKLNPHNAVPMSKAIVFLGSIASLFVNLHRMWASKACSRNTTSSASVIDVDACRVVVPSALLGTFLGVLLNWHTKDHVIVLLLTAVLVFMTGLITHKAWTQYCEETRYGSLPPTLPRTSEGSPTNVMELREPQEGTRTPSPHPDLLDEEEVDERSPLVGEHQQTRKENLDKMDMFVSGCLLCVVILSGVVRFHVKACQKEQHIQLGTKACEHPVITAIFWGNTQVWMKDTWTSNLLEHTATNLPVWSCFMMAVCYGRLAVKNSRWTVSGVLVYQVTSVATGLLAGLVGIGGGLILSPFFLLTGMEPSVAVGTSSTCVLFTASSTTMQYVFTDRIIMPLALVYGIVTFVASYTGTSLVHTVQEAFTRRRSYITFIVAFSVALSTALSLWKLASLLNSKDAPEQDV